MGLFVMAKKTVYWSVGQVAERAGVAVSALHYYEAEGLIHCTRNAGNQRRYKPSILRRIAVIKTAQKLGVALTDIKQALNTLPNRRTPTTQDWQKLSLHWRDSLQQRIDQLKKLRDQLDGCIGCGCLSLKVCSLRNPDDEAKKQGSGAVFLK